MLVVVRLVATPLAVWVGEKVPPELLMDQFALLLLRPLVTVAV